MGQVTIHLDAETKRKMTTLAKKKGVSKSRWISELIRKETDRNWPDCLRSSPAEAGGTRCRLKSALPRLCYNQENIETGE